MLYSSDTELISIFTDLPEIYKRFLPNFFNSGIPTESLATCNNCAMVCSDSKKEVEKLALKPFQPDKKCCTYHPSLPNYLVGGALLGASPEGKKRLISAINKKTGITPYGILTPSIYNVLYSNQSGGFGNSETLLCPYYLKETGFCGIWKYRESVCSTYFCKTLAGEKGRRFWMSLKGYLTHIEQSLAQHIIVQAGLDYFLKGNPVFKNQKSTLTLEELDGMPPKDYEKMWGEWNGREDEFFIQSFEQISELSKSKFKEITGIRETVMLKNLQLEHLDMLSVPDNLSVHEDWKPKNDEQSKKINYNAIDIQFELPSVVLNSFDGKRSISEAKKILEENYEIEVEDSMILSLYHYGILKEQD
tara:strand:+ start:1817 stop:2899 length:1083 start_codon:yes stop_codon:yes gene_type:complete